jgi:predicted Fe-S protein YdhL (DUF1289 family)|tara:strand:- start:1207 stop:1389 length:183 start_codon:yes stop_codon:yes gene_type:complete
MDKLNDENLSPCVGICQYNEQDLCSGCFRTSKEISQWFDMTQEEKKKVISLLPSRMEELF